VEPLGTYVEYDRERFPLAFEPSGANGEGELHYFGSVRGGLTPETNDAWDRGALMALMARNYVRSSQGLSRFQFPSKKFPDIGDYRNNTIMTNLQPSMAMAEGLPDAIAAITLKTPYLTSGSGTSVKDIRNVAGMPRDIYSAPAVAAFVWELALKANSVDSPGNPEAWDEMDPLAISPFFALANSVYWDEETGWSDITDLPSIFVQLASLTGSYTLENGETIDFDEMFTEEELAKMTTPFFGQIWPRPEEGPLSSVLVEWGADPDSGDKPLPAFVLSMDDAYLDAEGKYANQTFKENFTSKITISKDTAYLLSVATDPPLPNGASIEVRVNGSAYSALVFDSFSAEPKRLVFTGSETYNTIYLLDFCLKSPFVKVPGDTTVNVRLDPWH
jgi:hypothetical protein